EGIDREHVELLRHFAFQRKPRVAEHNGYLILRTTAQIEEVVDGDVHHQRIDVVKAIGVARPAIGADRAGAEPDRADGNGTDLAELVDGQADARAARVIGQRLALLFRGGEFLAVVDR